MTTALITGASAGLGVEFAHALAARGHDLILTARRADRLESLAADLRERHGVAVTVIPADLGQPGAAQGLIDAIGKRDLAVHILINNAGFGENGPFVDQSPERQNAMLDLNCRAVMELCRLVLPGMVQMRSGKILNVASTAAFLPGPWMALYYATKAFVLSLSEALHEEVRGSGVTVTALCPGPVRTEFFEAAGMESNAMFDRIASDAKSVVLAGLAALDAGDAMRIPGWSNRVAAFSARLAPRGLTRRAVAAFQRQR